MFMDLVLEGLLREHLMVAPLLVVVGITEQLVTMGAEDFKVWTVVTWECIGIPTCFDLHKLAAY